MRHPAKQHLELLAHDEWLRPMVRSLVAAHDVDDVLQETWLAAVRRPSITESRGWLARVARNFALLRRRRDIRRQRREALAASPEALPSTTETVQKLELQASIAKATAELAEPYREAVILRFHHGLDNAGVARAQGITVDNARQRVSRGLDHLRKRLAGERGPDWRLGSAFVALLTPPSELSRPLLPITTGILGAWIMQKAMGVTIAAVLLFSVLFFTVKPFSPGPELPEVEQKPLALTAAAVLPETVVTEPIAPPQRRVLETPMTPTPGAPPSFQGLVVDTRARPLADVEVSAAVIPEAVFQRIHETGERGDFEPEFHPIGVSDTQGRFAFTPEGIVGRLQVGSPYVLLRGPDEMPDWAPGDEILIVVAPAANLAGIVSDREGIPLQGVTIEVAVPELVDFAQPLDPTTQAEFPGTETREDGRFQMTGLPGGHSTVTFAKPGYDNATLEVGIGIRTGMGVVLHELTEGRFTLVGTVVDPRGQPLNQARIGIGTADTHTDRFGEYRFELDETVLAADRPLFATITGMQTFLHEDPRGLFANSSDARLDIVLQGPALELAGRILDSKGEPMGGVDVRLWKEAAVVGSETAADLALGGEVARRNGGRGPRVHAVTGADGSFALGGLQDKDYLVRLRDGETWLAWTAGPFRAGRHDLQLTAPTDALLPELRGRIVGRDRQPLANVQVKYSVQVHNVPPSNSWGGPDGAAMSDAEGRFSFENVPVADDILLVTSGDDVVVQLRYFSPDEILDEVVLEVDQRCNFRVEVAERGAFAQIQLRDEQDEVVRVWEHRGGTRMSHRSFPLTEGRTPIIAAGESARTLVFLGENGDVLDRLPIVLVPGQVNLIQR